MDDIFLNFKDIEQETNNELLNHALHYARCGFPVIQLQNLAEKNGKLQCSCRGGADCAAPGKHPRTRFGSKDATTDENKIFDWWDKHPQSNIGLLTGKQTGFFVLDIDIRTENYPVCNGELSLEDLQDDYRILMKEFAPLPATLTAFSGSGSRHLYFKYPLDLSVKSSAKNIGAGLDIKAEASYIIAPPSNHKSGRKYKWFGVNTPMEDAPRWLIYEIQKAMKTDHQKSNKDSNSKTKRIPNEKIPIGERNFYICSMICGLVNSFSKEEVLSRALEINETRLTEPLKEREIKSTVNWAWNKYVIEKGKNLGMKK